MSKLIAIYSILIKKAPCLKSIFKCAIEKKSKIAIGIVAGYNRKELIKSPSINAITDRWNPQPGQSKPVYCFIGQLNRCVFNQDKTPSPITKNSSAILFIRFEDNSIQSIRKNILILTRNF